MKVPEVFGWLASAGAILATIRKAVQMFTLGKKVLMAVVLTVIAVEMQIEGSAKGPEKKQAAQQALKESLDPILPDWANPIVYAFSGFLIDVAVKKANEQGVFKEFAAALNG